MVKGGENVIPMAITVIYPSKQGMSDLGYTRVHVSFHLIYKHSCCEYLIINQVVSSGKISNKWGHLLQPVAFGSRALKTGE